MQTIKALVVALTLLWTTPAQAQLPVIDIFAELQWPVHLQYLVDQITILTDQYEDMLLQGVTGTVPWNKTTHGILQEMADYLGSESRDGIFYPDDIDAEWKELFKGVFAGQDSDIAWMNGWLDRGTGMSRTHRQLLNLVKMHHESFEGDNERIQELQDAVDTAGGRNQLLKAQAALDAEKLRQQQMDRHIEMALANSQMMHNAYVANEQFTRESWQRAFLTNFDEEPELPQFVDRGL